MLESRITKSGSVEHLSEHKVLSSVVIIENNCGEILFLKRHEYDRTCSWLGLPGGKLDRKDMVQNDIIATLSVTWSRETYEETHIHDSKKKFVWVYDGTSDLNWKEYRTAVYKSTNIKWVEVWRCFPNNEHHSHHWLRPMQYLNHPDARPVTKQIIADYYGFEYCETNQEWRKAGIGLAESKTLVF